MPPRKSKSLHGVTSVKHMRRLLKGEDEQRKLELVLETNHHNQTLLHSAESPEIAELLIDSLPKDKRYDYVKVRDKCKQTPLHTARSVGVAQKVIACIPKDKHKYIMARDTRGKTCLHRAKSLQMAGCLISYVPDQKKGKFIKMRSTWSKQTCIHTAANAAIAQLILSHAPQHEIDSLIMGQDGYGQTILHTTSSEEMVDVLMSNLSRENRLKFMSMEDVDGITALANKSQSLFEHLLQYIEEEKQENFIEERKKFQIDNSKIIERQLIPNITNNDSDNLGGMYSSGDGDESTEDSDGSTDIWSDSSDSDDSDEGHFTAGLDGISPFFWMVVTKKGHKVSECLGPIQLDNRRQKLLRKNSSGKTTLEVAAMSPSGLRSYLWDHPYSKLFVGWHDYLLNIKSDSFYDMCAVLHFMTSSYPINSHGSLITYSKSRIEQQLQHNHVYSHRATRSAFKHKTIGTKATSVTKYLQESSTDLGGYLWLLADVVLSPPTKPEITLQALIDDVNSRPLHSLPKIIFLQYRVTDKSVLQTPIFKDLLSKWQDVRLPADFLVWSVIAMSDLRGYVKQCLVSQSHHSVQQELSHLWSKLKDHPSMLHSSPIHTTLGRQLRLYPTVSKPTLRDSPEMKPAGRGLVIYSQTGRPGYRKELKNAKSVMENQLGLEIQVFPPENGKDLTAGEMREVIKKFAEESKHCSLVVLAMMSHGRGGRIQGRDRSLLRVQEVLDILNRNKSQTKVLLLQFCRGSEDTPRVLDTLEARMMREYVMTNRLPVGMPGSGGSIKDETQHLEVPDNFFIVFSTLSGVRSVEGLWFEQMLDYLDIFWQHNHQADDGDKPVKAELLSLMTDIAGRVREESDLRQHLETVSSLRHTAYVNVYETL